MMKSIVITMLALIVSGCSVSKSLVRTTVHPETQHHINENTVFFVQLVNTIRLNSNVKTPSPDLKNQINHLVFQAGLIPQCTNTGCYLVRPGMNAKIRIEPDYIMLDFDTSYVKLEDVNQAAQMIYG